MCRRATTRSGPAWQGRRCQPRTAIGASIQAAHSTARTGILSPMVDLVQLLRLHPKIYERSICLDLQKDSGPTGLAGLQHCSMIACTARSGSSLVQVSLEHYGIDPQEWLNPGGAIKRAVHQGEASTLTQYGDYLARTARNGRFDLKGPLEALLFLIEVHEVPERNDAWRFIFLRRRNVLQQAISSRIAALTGQWDSGMPKRREVSDADYSFEEIARGATAFIQENANLEKTFAIIGIEPRRIYYEDFLEDISRNTWELARYVGLDVPPDPIEIKPRIERQFTDLNARWESRFREDMALALREPIPTDADLPPSS